MMHTMEAFQSVGLSPKASQANPVDLRSMLTSAIFSPDRTLILLSRLGFITCNDVLIQFTKEKKKKQV